MRNPFTHLAVFIFSFVALLQLIRLVLGWQVVIQGHPIPLWASGIAFGFAGGLAVAVWREARRAR